MAAHRPPRHHRVQMQAILLASRPVRGLMACVAALVAVNAAVIGARLTDGSAADAPDVVIVDEVPDDTVMIVAPDGSTMSVDPTTAAGKQAIADAEARGDTIVTAPSDDPHAAGSLDDGTAPAGSADADSNVHLPAVPGVLDPASGDDPPPSDEPLVSVTTPDVTITTPAVSITTPPVSITTPPVTVTTPPVSVSTPVATVTVPTTTVTVPEQTVTVPTTTVTVPTTTVTVPPVTVTVTTVALGL